MRRVVDQLGRISLPAEIREQLDIKARDEMEFFVENHRIVLYKLMDGCLFCNNADHLIKMGKYAVCDQCRKRLAQAREGDVIYPTSFLK